MIASCGARRGMSYPRLNREVLGLQILPRTVDEGRRDGCWLRPLVAGARCSTFSLSRGTASLSECCNVCMDVPNLQNNYLVSLEDVQWAKLHENNDKATKSTFLNVLPACTATRKPLLFSAGGTFETVSMSTEWDWRSGLCGTILCVHNDADLVRSAHK